VELQPEVMLCTGGSEIQATHHSSALETELPLFHFKRALRLPTASLLVLRLPFFFVRPSETDSQPRPLSNAELHHTVLRAGTFRVHGK
jgi:hypothetical protein